MLGVADYEEHEHPRGPDGRWVAKPKAPEQKTTDDGSVELEPGTSGLKTYLEMISKFYGDQPSVPKFILEHGREWPVDDKSFIGGTPHQCYMNAAHAVLENPKLTYVEGYISVHGVPISHAWTVDEQGKVRDYTIRDPKGIQGYYGVPFQQKFLEKQLLKNKIYGLLDGDPRAVYRVVTADPKEFLKPVAMAEPELPPISLEPAEPAPDFWSGVHEELIASASGGGPPPQPETVPKPIAMPTESTTGAAKGSWRIWNDDTFKLSEDGVLAKPDLSLIKSHQSLSEMSTDDKLHVISALAYDFQQAFPGAVVNATAIGGNSITVTASVPGASLMRGINFDTLTAHHLVFELPASKRAHGIGKQVLAGEVELYKKLGLQTVELTANLSVGGYAWAKYGFLPDKTTWDVMRGNMPLDLDPAFKRPDPKLIWKLADSPNGKDFLIGRSWQGTLDLNDPESMARFNAYVQRALPPPDPSKSGLTFDETRTKLLRIGLPSFTDQARSAIPEDEGARTQLVLAALQYQDELIASAPKPTYVPGLAYNSPEYIAYTKAQNLNQALTFGALTRLLSDYSIKDLANQKKIADAWLAHGAKDSIASSDMFHYFDVSVLDDLGKRLPENYNGQLNMFSTDYNKFVPQFISDWTYSGRSRALYLSGMSGRGIDGNVGKSFYDGDAVGFGERYSTIRPNYFQASENVQANLAKLYAETQEFYRAKLTPKAKKGQPPPEAPDLDATTFTVMRGVSGHFQPPGYVPPATWEDTTPEEKFSYAKDYFAKRPYMPFKAESWDQLSDRSRMDVEQAYKDDRSNSVVETYTPWAAEAWTIDKRTPERFGKMMAKGGRSREAGRYSVLTAQVPYSGILMSYEAQKRYFPPEKDLKGKKEFVVLGGALQNMTIERI